MIDIPEIYKDRYFIDTDSLFREYGVIVEKGGYEELTKEPKRKNEYTHVWLDQNGTERYINNKFETRNVTLIFTFLCDTLAEYLTKQQALFTELRNGVVTIGVSTLGLQWELFYDNETNVEYLTDIYAGKEVIARHTLTFFDDKVFPTAI